MFITEEYLERVETKAQDALIGYSDFRRGITEMTEDIRQFFLSADPLILLTLVDEIRELRAKDEDIIELEEIQTEAIEA
jgi:hypothetical protein